MKNFSIKYSEDFTIKVITSLRQWCQKKKLYKERLVLPERDSKVGEFTIEEIYTNFKTNGFLWVNSSATTKYQFSADNNSQGYSLLTLVELLKIIKEEKCSLNSLRI